MKTAFKSQSTGVQILCMGFFGLLLAGCVTCGDCNKGCTSPTGDPVDCAAIAIDVTAGDGTGCAVAPGASKKCSMANAPCPFSNGPYTCKTIGAPGNCSCKCSR